MVERLGCVEVASGSTDYRARLNATRLESSNVKG